MNIAHALSGGDRRSIGRSNDVVSYILKHKSALPELVLALKSDDVVVRMRAADALEKLTISNADWLDPYAQNILAAVTANGEQEIRWHAAQILPRLRLTAAQRETSVELLFEFMVDKSRIVQSFALTGLVDFAEKDHALRDKVLPVVHRATTSGIPSVEARARKLLKRMREGM